MFSYLGKHASRLLAGSLSLCGSHKDSIKGNWAQCFLKHTGYATTPCCEVCADANGSLCAYDAMQDSAFSGETCSVSNFSFGVSGFWLMVWPSVCESVE